MKTFLRMGSDYLDQATAHRTIGDACAEFMEAARELDRYGQRIEASLHFAPDLASVAEYPDRILSLGPRGGLKMERT